MPWRQGPAELRHLWRGPFETALSEMRDMKASDPDKLRRLIEENEPLLRRRATEAIRLEMKAARLMQARALRNEIEDIISPYLTDEQQREWTTIGPAGPGGSPPWPRPPRPGVEEFLTSRLGESDKPDPRRAKENYGQATKAAHDWEGATSPTVRRHLVPAFNAFKNSIFYDPKNWRYHWDFSQFLAKVAQQPDLGRDAHIGLLKMAIDQIDSATALCADPAQKKKMEEMGDTLRSRLPTLPAFGNASAPRPLPPRLRDRLVPTETPGKP
jgi:hypothetical protein